MSLAAGVHANAVLDKASAAQSTFRKAPPLRQATLNTRTVTRGEASGVLARYTGHRPVLLPVRGSCGRSVFASGRHRSQCPGVAASDRPTRHTALPRRRHSGTTATSDAHPR